MKVTTLVAALISSLLVLAPAAQAKAPENWDGLVKVPSKRLYLVYLQPEADFRGYTKVILDPTEVAFRKNWRRDYNSSSRGLGGSISESEVQEAVTKGVAAANDIFAKAWQKGGYSIVTVPGPDVLRVSAGIVNINVSAPDTMRAGRSRTFSATAGDATLVVEVRDSMTNALLGRAVDQRVAGDNMVGWRSSVSNRDAFRSLVEDWARDCVNGMAELKRLSPIKP
jgi:uncharacterized protein DUF3313